MSTSAYFRGIELDGNVDFKGWGASSSAGFQILAKQKKLSGLRQRVEPLEISQTSACQIAFMFETLITTEVSTEATMKTVIDWGLKLTGKVGQLKVGSTVMSSNAAFDGVTIVVDHSKGYILKWNFTIIEKGGGMLYVDKLRNPSFDATEYDVATSTEKIEGWTVTPNDGEIAQTQMFGIEELGDGQFAVKIKANATGTQPDLYQDVTMATDATSSDYEFTYWKFSLDAVFENLDTDQSTSTITLQFYAAGAIQATKTFTLVSGKTETLVLTGAVKEIYGSGADLRIKIIAAGADDDVIYIDNCQFEEVEL